MALQVNLDKIQLLGDRVLIQLDKAVGHTVLEGGVVVPLFENYETDGGRNGARVSSKTYLSQGTVVNISQYAKEKLPELNEGDKVFVTQNGTSPSYQFFPDRSNLVIDFTGLVAIPHVLIEAKIKD